MQTSWPGGMHALVGWEIFWDESAGCQEKRAAFKYTERRLKEKEHWERREECWGWVDQDFRRCGRDTELESWCYMESLVLLACGFNSLR